MDNRLQQLYDNVREHGLDFYKYLVFPMNSPGNKVLPPGALPYHWTVLIYNVKDQTWIHYNSLKKRKDTDPHLADATSVKKYIEEYIQGKHVQSSPKPMIFAQREFDATIESAKFAPQ